MPQQLLHGPDVVAVLEEMRRKGVPKRLTAHMLGHARALSRGEGTKGDREPAFR